MHEKDHNHTHIIDGNLEVLEQGAQLVLDLTDAQYNTAVATYACSSIGQHFRHILDMYQAILPALAETRHQGITTVIDYDNRRRGATVETQRKAALEELGTIKHKIEQRTAPLCLPVDVKTEVCLENTRYALIPSTLARELAFISSHAVHHFALINVIAKMLGASLDQAFGVAPASATHLRAQQQITTAIAS